MVAQEATAAFGPHNKSGFNGANHSSGPHWLWSNHVNGQPVRTAAAGKVEIASTLDWTTDAEDTGYWVGAISFSEKPRWEIKMKTAQPVQVKAESTNPAVYTVSGYYKSVYYRAEAHHLGWGIVNDELLVWGGAHYHLGNGETMLEEARSYSVSSTQQFWYSYKRYTWGVLHNVAADDNGEIIYMEDTREIGGPTIVVSLHNKTVTARSRHTPYNGSGHKLNVVVNDGFSAYYTDPEGGWIQSKATAWDDGPDPPKWLGTWHFE
jgi:hypothetical protein